MAFTYFYLVIKCIHCSQHMGHHIKINTFVAPTTTMEDSEAGPLIPKADSDAAPRRRTTVSRQHRAYEKLLSHHEAPLVVSKLHLFRECCAEFFSMFYICFSCAATFALCESRAVPILPGDVDSAELVALATVSAFTVMTAIWAIVNISGAYLNPVVVVCALLTKHLKNPVRGALFIVSQVLGGYAGSAVSMIIPNASATGYGATVPSSVITSTWQAFGIEAILTFFLVFVAYNVGFDRKGLKEMSALPVGLAVGVCVLVGGPLTGASMNPARSIGPNLFAKRFDDIWVYIIGPLVGGLAGCGFYMFVSAAHRHPVQTEFGGFVEEED